MSTLSRVIPAGSKAPAFGRIGVLCAPTAAALGLWVIAVPLAGVDLVAKTGGRVQHVGLAAVLVSSVVVTVAARALLALMQRRGGRALRRWTIVAAVALVVSLPGPLGARSAAAGLVLAGLHLLVGGCIILGFRRAARAR